MKTTKMAYLPIRTSISRAPLPRGFLLIALAGFALSPTTQAADGALKNDNTAEGKNALFSLTTGHNNTAMGFDVLLNNTTGHDNTAIGATALQNNTNGNNNTATGGFALFSNTSGHENTATGYIALERNTNGFNNTATGYQAMYSNTAGHDDTAVGVSALLNNTDGSQDTAIGFQALLNNTFGGNNTAVGNSALFNNTTANYNTAVGDSALFSNSADGAFANTATGFQALFSNTTGADNTANGNATLFRNTGGSANTAIGNGALVNNTTGNNNIALGAAAGTFLTTGDNNIDIGNEGVAGEANTIRIGGNGSQTATFIAGIFGATASGGATVFVNSNGQLGTTPSSQRFKDEIKPMNKVSEALYSLKPVTFRYKHELDPTGIPQFGLVAEEVEKVNPALVARDAQGNVFTVRYEAVNAMLLNEFLKEHRTVQELKSSAAKQEATIAKQQKQIEALTKGLQKVSAQVEVSKPAPQMVGNNQ